MVGGLPGPPPGMGLPGRPLYAGPPPGFPGGPLLGMAPGQFAGSPPVGLPSRPAFDGSALAPPTGPAGVPPPAAPDAPVFDDEEKAQEAFIGLLRSKGVDADWTWEKTMRTIVTEPLYKALKSLSERKAAFNKYVEELRQKQESEAAARREKAKTAWLKMFGDKIKGHNSFATAKKLFGSTKEWRLVKDDNEAKAVFDGIIQEKKKAEASAQRELRHRNMDMLMELFRNFEMDVLTRWRDAHRTVVESEEYTSDKKLQEMEVADMIAVFEEHLRVVEKSEFDRKKKTAEETKRAERKRRTACKQMMNELQEKGTLNANSKWSHIYPLIKDDERFTSMVGQPGSTPLDYFYDIVDELDVRLTEIINRVEKSFKGVNFKVTEETSEADFYAKVEEIDGWGDATEIEKPQVFEDVSMRDEFRCVPTNVTLASPDPPRSCSSSEGRAPKGRAPTTIPSRGSALCDERRRAEAGGPA